MIYKRKSIVFFLFLLSISNRIISAMNDDEIKSLREEVKKMFYHGYDSYMKYAFPADELMPLSCKGRFRDTEPNRGDIDDVLGNFTLTLIDSMDTLVVMNDLSEFENAVKNVINNVQFDNDIVVSVFETNIRVVGGLLSAHVLANFIKEKHKNYLQFYENELLNLAKDVAFRLLPAFDTPTGLPHPRINLKYGMKSSKIDNVTDTCTAGAGTIILEFAALSRLTNLTIFEEKARKAMDYIWHKRHQTSDLVGSVLNIFNGDWVRKESGVGAGIDSYYEYLFKAYVLLGDESYLKRFNKHYKSVMKYISQGPLLIDVHMHKPQINAKNFMDSLLAFWPGLQVLKGDLEPAIETHEVLNQVSKLHNYLLPEAFNLNDFQPYWAQFLIRPEFIESAYFLYEATNDSYYLEIGKQVLKSIKKYTMTECGFAAVHDVRTGKKDDRMDSFVLSETLKYLYLLFSKKEDLIIDLDKFIFTTEAHFLPLNLSLKKKEKTDEPLIKLYNDDFKKYFQTRSCPSIFKVFQDDDVNENFFLRKKTKQNKLDKLSFYEEIRNNFKDYVQFSSLDKLKYTVLNMQKFRDPNLHDHMDISTINSLTIEQLENLNYNLSLRLEPKDFSVKNSTHIKILKEMGISIVYQLENDKVQLVHLMSTAESVESGKKGIIFMKKMIELTKKATLFNSFSSFVKFQIPGNNYELRLPACPARFGIELNCQDKLKFSAQVALVKPFHGCFDTELYENNLKGKFALVERGDCMFIKKARAVQKLGAIGCIFIDNIKSTSAPNHPFFEIVGDNVADVHIPVLLLYRKEGEILLDAFKLNPNLIVHMTNIIEDNEDVTSNKLEKTLKEARKLIDEEVLRSLNFSYQNFKENLDTLNAFEKFLLHFKSKTIETREILPIVVFLKYLFDNYKNIKNFNYDNKKLNFFIKLVEKINFKIQESFNKNESSLKINDVLYELNQFKAIYEFFVKNLENEMIFSKNRKRSNYCLNHTYNSFRFKNYILIINWICI